MMMRTLILKGQSHEWTFVVRTSIFFKTTLKYFVKKIILFKLNIKIFIIIISSFFISSFIHFSEVRLNLSEVMEGILHYFDKSLGSVLLYRFERPQYADIVKVIGNMCTPPPPMYVFKQSTEWWVLCLNLIYWNGPLCCIVFNALLQSFGSTKRMCEVYGGEHLLRLFGMDEFSTREAPEIILKTRRFILNFLINLLCSETSRIAREGWVVWRCEGTRESCCGRVSQVRHYTVLPPLDSLLWQLRRIILSCWRLDAGRTIYSVDLDGKSLFLCAHGLCISLSF